jgi:hypothetical protein
MSAHWPTIRSPIAANNFKEYDESFYSDEFFQFYSDLRGPNYKVAASRINNA